MACHEVGLSCQKIVKSRRSKKHKKQDIEEDVESLGLDDSSVGSGENLFHFRSMH